MKQLKMPPIPSLLGLFVLIGAVVIYFTILRKPVVNEGFITGSLPLISTNGYSQIVVRDDGKFPRQRRRVNITGPGLAGYDTFTDTWDFGPGTITINLSNELKSSRNNNGPESDGHDCFIDNTCSGYVFNYDTLGYVNPPRACQVSDWSDWGNCTKTCSGGIQVRNRSVVSEPEPGGDACPPLKEERPCNDQVCNTDCVSNWINEGEPMFDPSTKKKIQKQVYKILTPSTGSGVPCTAAEGSVRTIEADQNCEPGEWGPWSDCNATCGGGKQNRSRAVVKEKSGNGSVSSCNPLTEERSCNTQSCPANVPNIDCTVTEWGEWSACDAACNQVGTSTRSAKSTSPKSGSGADCVMTQSKSCSGVQCAVPPAPPPPPPVDTTCKTVSGFLDYGVGVGVDSSSELLLPSNSPYRPQGSVFSLTLFNRK
jgi:hypothetical protein